MSAQRENLEVVFAFVDAMRRGDADGVAQLLDPGIVWRGVPQGAICRDRDEVMEMLSEELRGGLRDIRAVELVAGDGAVVLGVRSPQLTDIGEVPLPGQMFNVFEVRDGRIVSAQDYVQRADALRAAKAAEPGWT